MLGDDWTLSEETVTRYRRDGFVHVPGVLGESEVEGFRRTATELLAEERAVHWGEGSDTILDFVMDAHLKSTPMRDLSLHPRVTEIAERLAGAALRVFKLELLRKGPNRSRPTAAHLDDFALPFTGEPEPVGLTAWVALVDVPVERGCMNFVGGSHLLPPSERPSDAWEPLGRSEVRWLPRVHVPIRAGDCTFHHIRVVHGAGANESDRSRLSAATVYMDAAAVYRPTGNQEIDELSGAGELVPGSPLVGERFPLVGGAGRQG